MDLESIAALCAIIAFGCKVLHFVWTICATYVKKRIHYCINKILDFLIWLENTFLS